LTPLKNKKQKMECKSLYLITTAKFEAYIQMLQFVNVSFPQVPKLSLNKGLSIHNEAFNHTSSLITIDKTKAV